MTMDVGQGYSMYSISQPVPMESPDNIESPSVMLQGPDLTDIKLKPFTLYSLEQDSSAANMESVEEVKKEEESSKPTTPLAYEKKGKYALR